MINNGLNYCCHISFLSVHCVGLCEFRPNNFAATVKPIELGKCVYATCILSAHFGQCALCIHPLHHSVYSIFMSSCVGGSKAPPPVRAISTSSEWYINFLWPMAYVPYLGIIYVICITEECNYVLRARTRPALRCLSDAFCALPRLHDCSKLWLDAFR